MTPMKTITSRTNEEIKSVADSNDNKEREEQNNLLPKDYAPAHAD